MGAEFKCDRPTSLGMNVDSLAKILKMSGPSDSLKLRWQSDADTVSFQCEGGEDRIADFDLKLMQIESEHMEIPEQQYKVVAKLPSAEFQKICRDLKEFGETMQVKASKDGITFSVQGDVGAGNVMLKPRESEKPEEKVTLKVDEPVTATFALRYLVNFSKAAPLCGAAVQGRGEVALGRVPEDLPGPEGVRRDHAGEGWQGRHYFQCTRRCGRGQCDAEAAGVGKARGEGDTEG